MKHSILLLLFSFCFVIPYVQAQKNEKTAADFHLKDLNRKQIHLANVLDKTPVVLNFWALWCNPCLKELPHLDKLQKLFGKDRITIIAVNEDNASNQSKIKPFIRGKGYSFRVLLDPDHLLMRRYKLTTLPSVFLIDQLGKIVYFHQGYRPGDEKELEEAVEQLLNNKEK